MLFTYPNSKISMVDLCKKQFMLDHQHFIIFGRWNYNMLNFMSMAYNNSVTISFSKDTLKRGGGGAVGSHKR